MKEIKNNQLRNRIKTKMSRNTQIAIANKLGISQSYLSLILNGKRKPKSSTEILKKVSVLLSGFSNN